MGEIAIKHHNAEKFSDLWYKNNRKTPIDVALEQQPNRCRND
jgi:restriction endonuclease